MRDLWMSLTKKKKKQKQTHQKHFQAMTTVFPWSAEINHCKIRQCSHTACEDIFTIIFSLKYQLGQRL